MYVGCPGVLHVGKAADVVLRNDVFKMDLPTYFKAPSFTLWLKQSATSMDARLRRTSSLFVVFVVLACTVSWASDDPLGAHLANPLHLFI